MSSLNTTHSFHLDPVGGIAGDMFVAAVLDVRPDLEAGLHETLSACPLLEDISSQLVAHTDGILCGQRFIVSRRKTEQAPAHTDWRDIRASLEAAPLPPEVIKHATGLFTLLAEAEAKVHGIAVERVSFHEVGAWDSVADILSAAYLITHLGTSGWSCGALPLGSGRVKTAHGLLPVPAPATALLMEGLLTIDDGIGGERVTPTGAAIVRYLCSSQPSMPRRMIASGHGFGTRTLSGISNCLRLLAFGPQDQTAGDDVMVLECEIDDQTAEDLALAIDHLRAHPGVLDVIQAPVFGKKGRMMTHLRVLAQPGALSDVSTVLFEETTTIGIRHTLAQRTVLDRRHDVRDEIQVKIVDRPSGPTTKIEADELANTKGQAQRDKIRRSVEDDHDR